MQKSRELVDPDSCLNKAFLAEWLFVLLGRDVTAPATIRFWCNERIRLGKNTAGDHQIVEALNCAREMERVHQTKKR